MTIFPDLDADASPSVIFTNTLTSVSGNTKSKPWRKGGKTRATASFIKNPGEWHWISLDTAHGEVCRHHRGCVERIEVHSIDADASGTPSVTGMKRISAP
jgi:hypothetical protein